VRKGRKGEEEKAEYCPKDKEEMKVSYDLWMTDGPVRIISEAPLVCPNGCWYLLKDGGLVFHNLRLHKDNKLE
jgi:hypothetical protein